jgi:hypothetical protein
MFNFNDKTKIYFHKLLWAKEPTETGDWVVVRKDTDTGLYLDEYKKDALKLLQAGKGIGEVKERLEFSDKEMMKLLQNFREVGFIARVNEEEWPDKIERVHPMLRKVPAKYFSWLVSKVFLLGSFGYIVSGFFVILAWPKYLPYFADFFWSTDLFEVIVSIFVISLVLLVIHELAHFAFTKAVGAQGRIRFNYMYVYLVAETDEYYLSIVPKYKRYLTYLSGLLVELIILSSIVWLFYISDVWGWQLGVVQNLLWVTMLITLVSMVWQFNVFMETDIYNFLADYLDWPNLNHDARKYLQRKIWGRWRKHSKGELDLRVLNKKQRWQLRIYCVFLLISLPISIAAYLYFNVWRDLVLAGMNIMAFGYWWQAGMYVAAAKALVGVVFLSLTYVIYLLVLVRRK